MRSSIPACGTRARPDERATPRSRWYSLGLYDDRQVNWAIATRCQPDRDLVVVTNARGSDLDPSAPGDGHTAKWGVDATAKPSLAQYTPRHRVPPAVVGRLRLDDVLPDLR